VGFTTKSGGELRNMPEPEFPMLVDQFLGEGKTMLIWGKGGIGKSIFTIQLVSALTSGDYFLDKFKVARPCKVSYVQAENTEVAQKHLWRRVGMLNKQNDENLKNHYADILALDTPEGVKALYAEITKYWTPDVVVIDPFYKAIRTGSINDDEVCNKLTQNLDALRSMLKCAIIGNHHEHRSKLTQYGKKIEEGTDALAGSWILSAWATGSYQIVNTSTEVETEKFRKMVSAKDRDDNLIAELNLRLIGDGKNLDDPLYYEIVDPAASPQGYRKAVQDFMGKKPFTIEEITEGLGVERKVVGAVLRQFYKEHAVERTGDTWCLKEKPKK
jgi:hypothetical protein